MIFNKMRRAIKHDLQFKVHGHPFNLGLRDGTLAQNTFHEFLRQDRPYLKALADALKITAQRLPKKHQQFIVHTLSDNASQTANELHDKYLIKPNPAAFFQPEPHTRINPVVTQVTQRLLNSALLAPIELAIANALPCYVLYSSLGLRMQRHLNSSHPFRLWVESYSKPSFLLATASLIHVANELAKPLSPSAKQRMVNEFCNSTAGEIAIWDSVMDEQVAMSNKSHYNLR